MPAMTEMNKRETLCLFDVDGTLTLPRLKVTPEVEVCLRKLRNVAHVALVSGSDLAKVHEQMCGDGENAGKSVEDICGEYDYVFAENGLVAYQGSKLLGKESIVNFLGEDKCQQFINFCLEYMSQLTVPRKRGNFIEFRNGMLNITICGRSVTHEERLEFNAYDQKHQLRKQFVEALEKRFPPEFGLVFAIGGQISIDAYPRGWDKTYCLRWIPEDIKTVHFFGDKTDVGGNDHQIFIHEKTIGHSVKSPEDTVSKINQLFSL